MLTNLSISTPSSAADLFFAALPAEQREERVFVLPLDGNGKVLAEPILVSVGHEDGTAQIEAGSIFREALKGGAEEIIVAHNHPSGDLTPSKADINRGMKLTLGGEKVETADPKEARDKVVQFLTGNDDATMDNVDETTKRKAAIVMSLMHQGSLGSILTGVNNAFDPTAKMMQINVNEAGGYGGKQENSFSLSKDDKGNLSISGQVVFSGRLMLNLGRIDNNPKIKLTGTDGSLATYSGKISLSAADLDKLAKADWSKLDMQSILAVDLNQKIDDRFQKAADMIPDDFKFTGSVDVNFNIHADSLIDLSELT